MYGNTFQLRFDPRLIQFITLIKSLLMKRTLREDRWQKQKKLKPRKWDTKAEKGWFLLP